MRFIDPKDFEPIVTDFRDEIASFGDAPEEPVDFRVTIDDFKTLSEKALFYIQNNPDDPLVKEVQGLVKPTLDSIAAFKARMIDIAKTADEYNDLFPTDDDLPAFVRKNLEFNPVMVESFLSYLASLGFNDSQRNYAKELLIFVSQNGRFDRRDLLREELHFNDIFNSAEITKLVDEFDKIF